MSIFTAADANRLAGSLRPRPELAFETRRRERIERQARPSFLETIAAAASNETILLAGPRILERALAPTDPGYRLTPKELAGLSEGLGDEYLDAFSVARSRRHAELIRDHQLLRQVNAQRLAEAGFGGTLSAFGAAILDPAALAADIATVGVARGFTAARGATRLARIGSRAARTGAVVGTTEAGIEGVLTLDDPTRSWRDIALAFTLGGVLGAGVNAVAAGDLRLAARARLARQRRSLSLRGQEATVADQIARSSARAGPGEPLSPEASAIRDRLDSPELESEYRRSIERGLGLEDGAFDELGLDEVIARYGTDEPPVPDFYDDLVADGLAPPLTARPGRESEIVRVDFAETEDLRGIRQGDYVRDAAGKVRRVNQVDADGTLILAGRRGDGEGGVLSADPGQVRRVRARPIVDRYSHTILRDEIDRLSGGGARVDEQGRIVREGITRQGRSGSQVRGANARQVDVNLDMADGYQRYMARAFRMRNTLRNETQPFLGRVQGLDTLQLTTGDRWTLGGIRYEVVEADTESITLRSVNQTDFEGASGLAAMVRGNADELTTETFTLDRGELLPIDHGSADLADAPGLTRPRFPNAEPGGTADEFGTIGLQARGRQRGIDPEFDPQAIDPDYDGVTAGRDTTGRGTPRFSIVASLTRSRSRFINLVGNILARDDAGRLADADGNPLPVRSSAIEDADRISQIFGVELARTYIPAARRWARKNRPEGAEQRVAWQFTAFARFSEQVGRAVRRPAGTFTNDPDINAAADKLRAVFNGLRQMMRRTGVEGFGELPENPTYLTRIYNRAVMDDIVAESGGRTDDLVRLFRAGLRNGDRSPTPGVVEARGRAARGAAEGAEDAPLFDATRREGPPEQVDLLAAMTDEEIDTIARLTVKRLRETDHLFDIDLEDLESITEVRAVTDRVRARLADRSPRGLYRLRLDETVRIIRSSPTGQPLGELAFEDILDNNAWRIATHYIRHAAGQAAMARAYQRLNRELARMRPDNSATRIVDTQTLLDAVRREGLAQGETDIAAKARDTEVLTKLITARPIEDPDHWSVALGAVTRYNTARLGGSFGFAQLTDLARFAVQTGVSQVFRQVPELSRIAGDLAAGRAPQMGRLTRTLESLTGIGTHAWTNRLLAHFDIGDQDLITSAEVARSPMMRRLLRARAGAGILANATLKASGLEALTVQMQRLVARGITQSMYEQAKLGRRPRQNRLLAIGLTGEEWDRLAPQIVAAAKTRKGLGGTVVDDLDLEKFDQADLALLARAIRKHTITAVLENNPAALSAWMHNPVAKIITQFQNFAIASYEAMFVRSINDIAQGDLRPVFATLSAGLVGSIVYILQTAQQSVGRPDREEFLREKLSPRAIAAAAIGRNPYLPFVGRYGDSVLDILQINQPFFSGTRFSGLDSEAFIGNPTFNLFDGLARTLDAPENGIDRGDWRDAYKLLPFHRLPVIQNALEAIGGFFPEPQR